MGLYGDFGKEDGNFYIEIVYMMGVYRDDGKESANYAAACVLVSW